MAIDFELITLADEEEAASARALAAQAAARTGDPDDAGFDDAVLVAAEGAVGDVDVVVLPAQADEFVCVGCFLVTNRCQLAVDSGIDAAAGVGGPLCIDCAAR